MGNENPIVLENSRVFMARGHTAHATRDEAIESEKMMNVYAEFAENFMLSQL
jgi:prolyl-tRNA synthetase